MLKGVTRQIIEINNSTSPYFEKVVLYLRPEASAQLPELLKYEAKRYVKELEPHFRYRRRTGLLLLMIAAAGMLGAAVCFVVISR